MAAADYRLMTEATGQRIAAALEALVNLGDPVTIAHGGTGATTAAAALAALGGVAVTDIVNDLNNTATDKPISANIVNGVSSSLVTLSSGATIAFRKIGHVVCAIFSGNGHAQTSAQTDTGVIPNEYIPPNRVAQALTGSSGLSYCVLRSDGAVEYQNSDVWAAGTITYMV